MNAEHSAELAAIAALERIERRLREAGASLPVEVKGTIESAVNTGLSIALCLVVFEIEQIKDQQ